MSLVFGPVRKMRLPSIGIMPSFFSSTNVSVAASVGFVCGRWRISARASATCILSLRIRRRCSSILLSGIYPESTAVFNACRPLPHSRSTSLPKASEAASAAVACVLWRGITVSRSQQSFSAQQSVTTMPSYFHLLRRMSTSNSRLVQQGLPFRRL